jgi:hypothetical protein
MRGIVRIMVLMGLVLGAFGAGRLMAGTPFGGDDMGTVPTDSPKGPVTKCEGKVAKAAGKLAGSILKCHASRATGKFTDDAAEDACEASAKTKFTATKTTGCAACTNLGALATGIEAAVDTNNNMVACTTTGTPYGGDDTGNIPTDAPKGPQTKCENAVGKAVGKLVGSIVKCHISRSTGKLADDTAEDGCEGTALTKFMATKTAGCPSCVNLSTIATTTETNADGALNALVFCGSPSGAFLN